MAKKSMIEREAKREAGCQFAEKRAKLKAIIVTGP